VIPSGPLPERRLRFILTTKSGATPASGNEDYWNGDIAWVTPEDLGKLTGSEIFDTRRKLTEEGHQNCGAEIAPSGSLVLSKRAPIGQVAILRIDACCNQGCFLLTPVNGVEERFIYYGLIHKRPWLEILGRGSTFMELSSDDIRSVHLPFASFAEQDRIAAFLDSETVRIDGLIAQKQRMLVLLEEKRAAEIRRVVTGGLDTGVLLKPSGYLWLGEIPRHWEIKRSKRLLIERDDRSDTGDEEMLTVSHLTGVTPRSEKDVNMFEAESTEGYKLVSPDNLVINTLWAWMGAMGVARHEGIVSPAYHVYCITDDLLPAYVDYMVRTDVFKAEVTRFSKGVWSSRLRLYPEGLHEVWLPVPPLPEQRAIVAHLKAERERTAELETTLRASIELLHERRRALITAAVTGQVEPEAMTT
jgi:type I restriction enzyme S subunit